MNPPEKFGSYDPSEVTWLLKDLSSVDLELSTTEREARTQSGGHYSEVLPIEYQPSDDYVALFHESLQETSGRLAVAVGVVAEMILAQAKSRGVEPVLVSLARAGTPVAILLKRYLSRVHGMDVPHYAMSIIRGKGLDLVALRYVLDRHSPLSVQFVDGWTGKGMIARELRLALAEAGRSDSRIAQVDSTLAVLADPGSCTPLHGTRDDFLVPSALLNSTVSGLVSRTVQRDDLTGPGEFHGAKFYSHLQDVDVSGVFLDAVSARFEDVEGEVESSLAELLASDRTPSWAGWEFVESVVEEYDSSLDFVKPGVGETTRVLLRRVPDRILYRSDRSSELVHVRMLAEARGVPMVEVASLPYSCVGVIAQVGRDA